MLGRALTIWSILCVFISCTTNSANEFKSEPLAPWIYEHPINTQLNVGSELIDTPLDLEIGIAHNDQYLFENLYVKYSIISAGDTLSHDVKSMQLQNDLGVWKGKSKEGKYYLKETLQDSVVLKSATAMVTVTQYSRSDTLPGIEHISLAFRKPKP